MRKPIVHMSFHPSVKGWTYDQFVERYKDQLTEDEITHFATSLGLVSEPAASVIGAPVVDPGKEDKKRSKQKIQPNEEE